MTFTSEIGKYSLHYQSQRPLDQFPTASILLYNQQDQFIGHIRFYEDGTILPDNIADESSSPKRATLRMHDSQLERVVDMLRNEKPCRFFYGSPKNGQVFTGKEPVGEEEGFFG